VCFVELRPTMRPLLRGIDRSERDGGYNGWTVLYMKDYKKLVVLEGGKEGQGGNTASKNDAQLKFLK
jgi:hypothetical protein